MKWRFLFAALFLLVSDFVLLAQIEKPPSERHVLKAPEISIAANQKLESQASLDVRDAAKQGLVASYSKLPLTFDANQGQTDPRVKFMSKGGGYSLFLTTTEAVLVLSHARGRETQPPGIDPELLKRESGPADRRDVVLRIKLVGASPTADVGGVDQLSGRSNYFIGNDPTKWHTNVPAYLKVKYQDIYPRVDLLYYGNHDQLEYDFVVAPRGNPGVIKLLVEGEQKLHIDAQGDVVLHLAGGEVRLHKPLIFQWREGSISEAATC